MCAVCSECRNPHTNKNSIAHEGFQNRSARWICGSRFCPRTYRWSKSSEECCTELFLPLDESTCPWPWFMTFPIIMFLYSLVITLLSLPLQPGPIYCPFYVNSPPLTHFSWTVSFGGTPFHWILSIIRRTTFRHLLYNSLCVN